MNEILEYALIYAKKGWYVFPIHGIVNGKCTCKFPGCKPPNSGKHPATIRGVKDATLDESTIRKWFENNPHLNLAIATGIKSKIWILDIDGAQGEEALAALEAENGKLPATMESTTGRGRHLIFKHTGEELKNSASKIGLKIDSRGDGGYIVAPPSRHYSGAVYTLNDGVPEYAPDWLEALARGEKKRHEEPASGGIDFDSPPRETDWTVADVRDMLAALDPDMDYLEWARVGMALHEGGFSVLLWDEWSRRGKKYQSGDCVKRWRGFKPGGGVTMGTLVEKAIDAGWSKEKIQADPIAAAIAARLHAAFMRKQKAKEESATPGAESVPEPELKEEQPLEVRIKFPNPMTLPGIIGDTVRWIVETSIKPQPELALLHTLAALGAVFGRRYKCQGRYDSRPNVYMIGIAGSGSGKEHSRKQLGVLMNQANLERFLGGGRFVSDTGLLTALKKQPTQVMPIDEIGLVLQSMNDKKAAGYYKNIATHLLTLYSSSGGFFNAGQYADEEKEAVVLKYPNLCIYGTTTKENYVKALTSDAITDGNLNRFIVVPTENEFPDRNGEDDLETTPPHSLVMQWDELQPPKDALPADMDLIVPTPTIVTWTKEVGLRLKNAILIEDNNAKENVNGLGRLWNRYRDSVQKVAMIFAICRNQQRPEILSGDLDIAEGIVQRSIEYISELCLNSVSDSEHEKNCQKVMTIIKREKMIYYSELYAQIRYLKAKELKEVLDSLEEQNKIEIGVDNSVESKKKPKVIRAK